MNPIRRRVLGAGVAGGALSLCPVSSLFAQSASPGALLRVPKRALVIGNSNYRQAPLKNPVNDAQGMAAILKSTGFDVTLGLELSQADLRDAIRAYSESLIKAKAVGLFYFAGHGVQLAWRNYLIPVDADITSPEELRERAIDMNSLIEGIRKAGNPMNIIIIDACRDNPFGSRGQTEQKGLSQIDAPPGTLLAYATAPGNTANDGEGANGLYTEHLLREMKVPEAKVEDIFKRVRLGVRRKSNGQQIPWESTSLEEDFWFIAPKELKKLAEEEAARAFAVELAVWERIEKTNDLAQIEEYLRVYPSGQFSELAQLRLDRALAKQGEKKIELARVPDNPYSKGTARTDTAFRVGDRWSYRNVDSYTGIEARVRNVVSNITEHEVIFGDGRRVTDLLGNVRRQGGTVWGPNQTVPAEFIVGKRWKSRFDFTGTRGAKTVVNLDCHIVDKSMITVPAGTFNAFQIQAKGWATGDDFNANAQWDWKRWYAPEQVRQHLVWDMKIVGGRGDLRLAYRSELTEFRQQ